MKPPGSSPGQFDAREGTYATKDVSFDARSSTLSFNVVQWLSGDDARDAWRKDNADEVDGPPNGYYIIDESPRLRRAELDPDVRILLTHLRTDGTAQVEADALSNLESYVEGGQSDDTYWLTFDSGLISEICEQYRP